MLSSQSKNVHLPYKPLLTLVSIVSPVILMLRTYAFTGRKRAVLAALLTSFFTLVGVAIWVMSKKLSCLF